MAAGGQGAPLAPLFHAALAGEERPLGVLNLGGIGNLTWLGADDAILAFDTGPASGLIVHGDADRIVPKEDTVKLVERLQAQKGITIDYENMKGANHFFEKDMDSLDKTVGKYLDRRIAEIG